MAGIFKNVTAASSGVGLIQLPTSIRISQDHIAAPFSASNVPALQAMLTDYVNHCNASSSVPASEMTTQFPFSNYSEARDLQIVPKSPSFYQGQSVDNGTALHQSILKLQSDLEEINGRLQQQPNLSDEVKVKASKKVEESSAEHKPNIIIAPCPARGMPFDHNYKTAHFTISDETGHGDELVCSYLNCQRVGIKFLYCGFCKLPVPKRNFCKFHSHSEEIEEKEKPAPKQETSALESKYSSLEEIPACTEILSEPDGLVNKKHDQSKMTQKTLDTCKKSSNSLKVKKEVKPAKKRETPCLDSKYPSLEETRLCTKISRESNGPVKKKCKRSKTTHKTQDTRKKSTKSLKVKKEQQPTTIQETSALESKYLSEEICTEMSRGPVGPVNMKQKRSKTAQKTQGKCKKPSKSLKNKKEMMSAPKQDISSLEPKYQYSEEAPLCTEMSRELDGPVNKKHKRSKMTRKAQDTCKKSSKSLKIKKHSHCYSPPDGDFDGKSHRCWVQLLHERPSAKKGKMMSIWLTNVLRVSEACIESYNSQADKNSKPCIDTD